MANPEHLAKLKEGVSAWNRWRSENFGMEPNLRASELSAIGLKAVDLSVADLRDANLSNTDLSNANLYGSRLRGANLSGATLTGALLLGTRMSSANLGGADLSAAIASGADMSEVNLMGARTRGTIFGATILSHANLCAADLQNAVFCNGSLQYASLDEANITGCNFWETQHAHWSIKGVICEYAYWDEKGKVKTEYAPGEFERLHSGQTCIELFYENGISTFELNTLPALLQHLASRHRDTEIHLKTIEETGGGAKITISLGDASEETKAQAQADATQLLHLQLALRESEGRRLQLQDDSDRMFQQIADRMFGSVRNEIHFHAPVRTAALPSGNARVDLHQTFNDNTELIQLIDKLLIRNTELTSAQSEEVEEAKAELQKPAPDKPALKRSLEFLKDLATEAIKKGAGKLGERAASADWAALQHQLTQFIHHLS